MSRLPVTDAERASLSVSLALYESLAADLRDTIEHGWPDPADLSTAPVIDDWMLSDRLVPILEGHTTGHPVLSGPWTRTSPLHAFSLKARAARTQSRWYRLGEPLQRRDRRIVPTCELR